MERAKGGTIGTESQTYPETGMQTENVPIGPVIVVGACNFPFAISVVGTDTASALAVGCPVVVKAHPDHARTCQSLADLVEESLKETGMPAKLFNLFTGSNTRSPANWLSIQELHASHSPVHSREEKPSANWPPNALPLSPFTARWAV